MLVEYLPTYPPFLNPIEEIFSAWRWKVYDRHLHVQMALLAAMDAACDNITAESCRGWIRHSRRYFSRCIARDICCDVDENIWPDRQERLDVPEWFTYVQLQYVLFYCYLVPWRELTRYCNDPLHVCVYVCVSVRMQWPCPSTWGTRLPSLIVLVHICAQLYQKGVTYVCSK